MKIYKKVKSKILLNKFYNNELIICLKFYSYLDYLKILNLNVNCEIISFNLLKLLINNTKKYSGGYYCLIYFNDLTKLNLIYNFLNNNNSFSLIFLFNLNKLYFYSSKNFENNNNLLIFLNKTGNILKKSNNILNNIMLHLLLNLKELKKIKQIEKLN